jgi:hypothetical protein
MTTSEIDDSPIISLPLDDDGLANCKKRVERLRHTNSVLYRDLENAGAEVTFVIAMLETYFEALVDMGALREDQHAVMQLIWEERWNKRLTEMKAELQRLIDKARVERRLQVPGRQNGQQQLIIPGT